MSKIMRTLINVGLCTYVMYAKCQNLHDSGHRGKKSICGANHTKKRNQTL